MANTRLIDNTTQDNELTLFIGIFGLINSLFLLQPACAKAKSNGKKNVNERERLFNLLQFGVDYLNYRSLLLMFVISY
jgi:hypothetical protein